MSLEVLGLDLADNPYTVYQAHTSGKIGFVNNLLDLLFMSIKDQTVVCVTCGWHGDSLLLSESSRNIREEAVVINPKVRSPF